MVKVGHNTDYSLEKTCLKFVGFTLLLVEIALKLMLCWCYISCSCCRYSHLAFLSHQNVLFRSIYKHCHPVHFTELTFFCELGSSCVFFHTGKMLLWNLTTHKCDSLLYIVCILYTECFIIYIYIFLCLNFWS